MPRVLLGDLEVYYEVHGDGKPLILLHGLGSSTRDWQFQLDDFAARYQVITLDLRGYGQTDHPRGPYSIRQMSQDVVALADHLEISNFHLLGYSMGGAVALQLAVDHSHRVDKLIVVNSQPSFVPAGFRQKLEYYMRKIVVSTMDVKRLAPVIARRLFPNPDQQELRELVIDRYSKNDTQAYLATLNALANWSVAPQLNDLTMPTLFIAAEHDYTSVEDKKRYVDQIPNARMVVVENSRHGTPLDQPEAFKGLVLDFLTIDQKLPL
jgi:3-oxoadipate enol-lactonase